METNDLIKTLARDARAAGPSLTATLAGALLPALLVAAVVFFAVLGPRPDFMAAAATPRFLLKFVVTGVLAATAFACLPALLRPGAQNRAMPLLLLAPAIIAVAVLVEFTAIPRVDWAARWIGTNNLVCLACIPLIGAGPLAVFLAALRRGAPTRPAFAGAVAGLLAGGIGALFYAAHCTDDSPFFVATWYGIAIAVLALLGALLGRRLLRW